MTDELQSLKRHIGQSETDLDVVTASAIARMAATLGVATPASEPGDPIPPGWHTAFFPPTHRTDQMRADGQAAGGGIMPKVPLPRRRLKGESLRLFAPLGIGRQILGQHLDGDIPLQLGIVGAIDVAHTAGAEAPGDVVVA